MNGGCTNAIFTFSKLKFHSLLVVRLTKFQGSIFWKRLYNMLEVLKLKPTKTLIYETRIQRKTKMYKCIAA